MQNFNTYGCTIRCLLEMASRHGRVITEQEVLAEFGRKYPNWLPQPGIIDVMAACEIARAMGLAGRVLVTIDQAEMVKFAKGLKDRLICGVLVVRERNLVNAVLEPSYHTMLLVDANNNGLKIWSPQQDGTGIEEDYTWAQWQNLMMHGLLFAPY